MSETVTAARRRRRRPGGPPRWTESDKAAHLAAFARRPQTIRAYCTAADVPRATFTLWQREARQARAASPAPVKSPRFARVELLAPSAPVGLTLVVRRVGGLEAELTGLDAATVVTVLQGVLGARGS